MAATAQTSAKISGLDMSSPSKDVNETEMAWPRLSCAPLPAGRTAFCAGRVPGAFAGRHGPALEDRDRPNSLFCQCAVQKVEPILSPEHLAVADVRRRAEHAAVD